MLLTHLQQRLADLLAHLPEQQADAALRILVEAWNGGRHDGMLAAIQRIASDTDRQRVRAELLPQPPSRRPPDHPW